MRFADGVQLKSGYYHPGTQPKGTEAHKEHRQPWGSLPTSEPYYAQDETNYC
ncbi:MAG: hypothetical protein V7642_3780 [Burkholderiales bacterium]|jgi:hypothetical protein